MPRIFNPKTDKSPFKNKKGLGPRPKGVKPKKAKPSDGRVILKSTAKRLLKTKTGLNRVAKTTDETLDRRMKTYIDELLRKALAVTGSRKTITKADIDFALRNMTIGPIAVAGNMIADVPFQKSRVLMYVKKKASGKRLAAAGSNTIFSAINGYLNTLALRVRLLHSATKTKTITPHTLRVSNDICK